MRINDLWSSNIFDLSKNQSKNTDFTEDIKKFIYTVNEEIERSKELKREFIEGKDIPVYEIMIQGQKAKISLELLTKIRDEALKAYNSVINMRL